MSEVNFEQLSEPEQIVYAWLTIHNVEFRMQAKLLGGFLEAGGQVADFLLDSLGLAIRVMGVYWHEQQGIDAQYRDRMGKINLMGLGYMVVDVWEDKLKDNADYVLERALQGEELPR